MPLKIDRKKLEEYVARELTPAMKRRVEQALDASADVRQLLEEVQREAEIVDAVKDSQAIRLPDRDEERIVSDVASVLRNTLDNPESSRPRP